MFRFFMPALLAIPALAQAPAAPALLQLGHLQDGVDRLLLRLADEAAGVDDDHLGLGRVRDVGEAGALRDEAQME